MITSLEESDLNRSGEAVKEIVDDTTSPSFLKTAVVALKFSMYLEHYCCLYVRVT